MPKISVVLPVFNAQKTVRRAIQSVLNQSLTDLEVIVVDDGSTDDTAVAVKQIRDSRVKLIRERHHGVALASNTALKNSSAPFVARMDADDFCRPNKLQKQLQHLTANELDVVGCGVQIVDAKGNPAHTMHRYQRWINEETATSDQIHALRFVELPLVNPTILARRAYFELGFVRNAFPEDYNLMLTACDAGMKFGKVNEVLFDWTDSTSRLTRTDHRYSNDAFMKCRRHHLLQGPLNGVRTVDLWGAGQTGKPWLKWLQSVGIEVRQTFEVNKRKIGKRIHEVPVTDVEEMPEADGVPLIIAVGADGARKLIWQHIADQGFVPGKDAWFVA